jgi:hypothetical protein
MSQIALSPNASGTGTFTIAAPNSNNSRTLTLPDAAGTLLTTNGDGSALTGIPTDFVLLATGTASASSSLDFTAFNSSLYGNYLFVVSNLVFSTTANLNVRTSTNGGSTYDSGASDYMWWGVAGRSAGISREGVNATSVISLLIYGANTTSLGVSGTTYLFGPDATNFTGLKSQFVFAIAAGDYITSETSGARLSAADVDGIRFLPSTGTITSGTIRMYGIKK